MASKRPNDCSPPGDKAKKSRKSIGLDIKLNIVTRHEGGEGVNSIARALGLSQSTVSTVLQKKVQVKQQANQVTNLHKHTTTRNREPIMEKLERLLRLWIEDHTHRRMPLSTQLVTTKALSLWEDLKPEFNIGETVSFKASKGWFERFKHRGSLHNLKVSGEAASSDQPAANAFKPLLKERIEEGGYSAKQVLNFDETGLYWKKMSSRTFIAKEEKSAPGFKASKDRLTLLVGGNAAGDLKLKPCLIYHSQNSRALSGYIKGYLPVVWKANKKGWMTTVIMQSYVTGYLSKFLKEYAAQNNIANRFLLLCDNAPSHPESMNDWADNIEVMFMPPNTTALIQPMDQGVIATFKAYYQRRTMKQLLACIDTPDKPTMKQFWKDYNIKKGIDNIDESWKEVSKSTMNGCWRNLWPECVERKQEVPVDDTAVRKDIVHISHKAGFNEVDENDVQELLDSHSEPLSNDDLMELEKQNTLEEMEEDKEPERTLSVKIFEEIFNHINQAIHLLQENDPNPNRSNGKTNAIENDMKVYKELFEAKKRMAKQTVISSFFKPSTSQATPSTSKAIPSTSIGVISSYFKVRPATNN